LVNSLDGLGKDIYQNIYNRSEALYAQANWHLSQPLTLTTGLRLSHEERANNATSTLVTSNGFGGNLNPVTVNNVPLGYSANAAAQYYFGTASYSALTRHSRRSWPTRWPFARRRSASCGLRSTRKP
jgi:iron complex outermembrane recepter protein